MRIYVITYLNLGLKGLLWLCIDYTNGMAVSICVTLQKSARDASAHACWGNIPGALLSAVDVTGV